MPKKDIGSVIANLQSTYREERENYLDSVALKMFGKIEHKLLEDKYKYDGNIFTVIIYGWGLSVDPEIDERLERLLGCEELLTYWRCPFSALVEINF